MSIRGPSVPTRGDLPRSGRSCVADSRGRSRGFAPGRAGSRGERCGVLQSDGVHRPAPAARPAATVVLLRDAPRPGPGGARVQVFLQRRVAGMAFAGGMTVFPGGSVDTGDRPDPGLWRGPGAQWWARRFGCSPDEAGAAGRRGGARDVRGVRGAARRTRRHHRRPGRPATTCWPGAGRSATSWARPACRCVRTCSPPGSAGSPRRPSRGATTRRSSSPSCRTGRTPTPGPPRPSRPPGGTRPRRSTARSAASCA